jgi:hypothetical protein
MKKHIINLRLDEEELELFKANCRKARLSQSDYMRFKLLEEETELASEVSHLDKRLMWMVTHIYLFTKAHLEEVTTLDAAKELSHEANTIIEKWGYK